MTLGTETGRAYNALLERTDRIIATRDIRAMCKLLKVDYNTVYVGLKRWGVLVPVAFKGVYYLKNWEERDRGVIKEDPLAIVAMACNLKLGDKWYFGLITALNLAGLWGQQMPTKIVVITRKQIYGVKEKIGGMEVEFKQLRRVPFDKLMRKRGPMRFSDPARTILDYAYFNAKKPELRAQTEAIFKSVSQKAGGEETLIKKAQPLIPKYPALYAIFLKKFLGVDKS